MKGNPHGVVKSAEKYNDVIVKVMVRVRTTKNVICLVPTPTGLNAKRSVSLASTVNVIKILLASKRVPPLPTLRSNAPLLLIKQLLPVTQGIMDIPVMLLAKPVLPDPLRILGPVSGQPRVLPVQLVPIHHLPMLRCVRPVALVNIKTSLGKLRARDVRMGTPHQNWVQTMYRIVKIRVYYTKA
jgi:hypothetical protein